MYDIPKTVPHEVAAALLLLSREHLTAADYADADVLLRRMEDGNQLIDLAFAKLSLPFVAQHLAKIEPPWYASNLLQDRLYAMTLQSLRVAGAQVKFHQKCIAPLKVRHAYIKGLALGAQYYSGIGLRFARDVDVIVDRKQIREMIATAQSQGYRLIDRCTVAKDTDRGPGYRRSFAI